MTTITDTGSRTINIVADEGEPNLLTQMAEAFVEKLKAGNAFDDVNLPDGAEPEDIIRLIAWKSGSAEIEINDGDMAGRELVLRLYDKFSGSETN